MLTTYLYRERGVKRQPGVYWVWEKGVPGMREQIKLSAWPL